MNAYDQPDAPSTLGGYPVDDPPLWIDESIIEDEEPETLREIFYRPGTYEIK